MKLSQLTQLNRVNLKHFKQLNYSLGATLLILGGFFYSHNIFAKSPEILKTPSQHSNFQTTKKQQAFKSIKQSTIKSEVSLQKIEKQISLPLKNISPNTESLDANLKNELTDILSGTPMENMIEPISKQDRTIAAFLVGIALKESQFGKHSPKLHGKDCYNYWGYRGKRARMGTGGHTCFDSPEDAVNTVSKRLETLVFKQHRTTPQKMLIWKCGNSCATHSPSSVTKWVADVSIYFNKLNS